MIWKRMTSAEAKKIVSEIEVKSSDDFNALVEEWKTGKFSENVDVEYREIRNKVFEVYDMNCSLKTNIN